MLKKGSTSTSNNKDRSKSPKTTNTVFANSGPVKRKLEESDFDEIESLKKELIEYIQGTDDIQKLRMIKDGIFKAESGNKTDIQIFSYITKEYQHLGLKTRERTKEKKYFMFDGKPYEAILEDFYFEHEDVLYEIEFDDNFHAGAHYNPNKEIVREFEYFKQHPLKKVVLLRYGFKQRQSEETIENFIASKAEIMVNLIQDIKENGDLGKKIKSIIDQPYDPKSQKKIGNRKVSHFVCFYGYDPENRHLKEHTIFAEKGSYYSQDKQVTNKITKTSKNFRLIVFPYNIDIVNEVYKHSLNEPLKYT